jgi:hypothetical protein
MMADAEKTKWRYFPVAGIALFVTALCAVGAPGLISPPDRDIISPNLVGDAVAKAITALAPEQRETLIKRERNRLQSEPLDSSALDNLSILESLENNSGKAEAFASESARRSLRNVQAQLSILRIYLKNQDYANAMFSLDGVLMSEPQLKDQLFPSVASVINNEQALHELAKVLNRNPAWRGAFFLWLGNNDKSDQVTFRLFNSLRKQGGQPSSEELQAYINTLFGNKDYDRAYFVWLDSLDQNELKKVGNVFDGGFDLEPKNRNFDWTIIPFANAEMTIVPRGEDQTKRALRLSFFNSKSLFGHVFQFLRLQQGHYRFEGEEAGQNFRSPGGLKFTVSCADTGAVLGSSEVFDTTAPWKTFSFDFAIPAESCLLPILRLQSASSAVLDTAMNGEILFDNIKIEKTDSQ